MRKRDNTMEILVVGSLNMDFRISVDHLVSLGETKICKHLTFIPGGKGANQAYASGHLGNKTTMLGAIGNDSYGRSLLESLTQAHVDTSHIVMRNDSDTGIAMVQVDEEGNNAIVVVPGANSTVDEAYIDQNIATLEQCDLVLLQLEIPLQTVVYIAKLAKSMGKIVVLDPAPAPSGMPPEIYKYIDFIKPNEHEIRMLTGEDDIDNGMRKLLQYGVGCVIVTVGKEGSKVLQQIDGPIEQYPTPDVPIIDTTAAGDSFIAAFASAFLETQDISYAVTYANRVGAFVVTKNGAQSSIPNQEELASFYKDF